ncbi:MAG: hypothetical protein A3F17_05115 [Gammaproteobacteria bacterium RIFCSPHIGHO2_12_FULL_41_15]|nr:MAG: hypothetical protein A3F17_05115 [Gammaproteobacteria bacterium RIFCSPHIGHO2_12_FULL_41_15]
MARKKGKKNKKGNYKKQGVTFYFKNKIFTAIVAIISIFLPLVGASVFNHHKHIQNKFDQLVSLTRNQIDIDEFIYNDCSNKNSMASDVRLLRRRLGLLLNEHQSLGKLVSLKTYCMLHSFTKLNDKMQDVGLQVCLIAPMPKEEIIFFRDRIIRQIVTDKISRRGFFSSLEEYFSKKQDEKHRPVDCLYLPQSA